MEENTENTSTKVTNNYTKALKDIPEEEIKDVLEYAYKKTSVYKNLEVAKLAIDYFGEELVSVQNNSSKECKIISFDDVFNYYCSVKNIYRDFQPDSVIHKILVFMGFTSYHRILIWFPYVVVENEFKEHETIYDLYVKLMVYEGTLEDDPEMCRSTYTKEQWNVGYSHSHLPRLSHREVPRFTKPCWGTGPIVKTIASIEEYFDLDLWGLFFFELSKYVKVESIEGQPFTRMATIYSAIKANIYDIVYKWYFSLGTPCTTSMRIILLGIIKDWFKEYIQNNFIPLSFIDNHWSLGDSLENIWVKMSSSLLSYMLSDKIKAISPIPINELIDKCFEDRILNGNNFYLPVSSFKNLEYIKTLDGAFLFTFKDKQIILKFIEDIKEYEGTTVKIIRGNLFSYIITQILVAINYGEVKCDSEETI